MRSPATSATSATPTTTKAMKFAIATIFLLLAILFGLFFRAYFSPQASISPSHLSLRQHHGLIQWKPTNAEDTDDNWHTITTVSALTGKDGKDGTDGQNGANGTNGADGRDGVAGQNGQDGNNGSDGANGQNGTHGQSGPQGEQGEQGIQGPQGNQGQSGANGNDGQDGADGLNGTDGRDGADGRDGIDGQNGQDGTNGTNGREIELQKDLYYIQWRYVGEPGWRNLIAYSDLKGEKGDTGATGPANNLSIGAVNRTTCTPTASITGTAPSQTLNLGIPGLPTGGTAGQVLTKNSNTDCDTSWQNTGELKGNGMPNGTVTAPVGTYYTDTAGTNGAWRWLKTTGAGNTGWTVVYGDTGWRNLVPELPGSSGTLLVRRVNNTVEMAFNAFDTTQRGSTDWTMPAGFRVSGTTHTLRTSPAVWMITSGYMQLPQANYTSSSHSTWITTSTWPETLPGVAH